MSKFFEIFGAKYLRMDQVNLWKAAFKKFEVKFFKGCLPQILLGPFLNILSRLGPFL